ncbi:23S rRNA (uracil(1939)-C(5))-methyltransferase RlmD [Anaerocolumna jejuensis]|uniref:23S rRNA (uracil(1939)-C(5))-methyltransferase RlmD n=1 Tax=Anaerocolumna jejuensis TaxID=259063 RepID=UPI003F7C51DA
MIQKNEIEPARNDRRVHEKVDKRSDKKAGIKLQRSDNENMGYAGKGKSERKAEAKGKYGSKGKAENNRNNENRNRDEDARKNENRSKDVNARKNENRSKDEDARKNENRSKDVNVRKNENRSKAVSARKNENRSKDVNAKKNEIRSKDVNARKNENRSKDVNARQNENRSKDVNARQNENKRKDASERQNQNRSMDISERQNQNKVKSGNNRKIKNERNEYSSEKKFDSIKINKNGKVSRKESRKESKEYWADHKTEYNLENKVKDKGGKDSGKYTDKNTNRKSVASDNKGKKYAEGTCPYRRDCGSCKIHEKSYKEHLIEKQKLVTELLSGYCPVKPIVGMEDPAHYRNKVHVVFDRDRRGNAISGIYEEGTHRVIPIESCLIHNQKADEIIASIRGLLKSFKIKTYDEDTGYGLLRHVLIRTGYHSKEIMVVLVIGSPIFPSKSNFVKAIRQLHPEISTIIVNVNDKNTSMVLGEKEHVIYGKGFIEDTLCEKVFRISPKSFYQVNPTQTEKLYRLAIDMAELKGKETILDAYCGIGTIGLIASDKASKVIGVELNKDAVADARVNAKRNETSNIQFYLKDAGEFMAQLAEQNETVDVVFMDPPRAGSDEKFLNSLAILKPAKVVYISCNPVTLQRDIEYLVKKGYKAEKAVPVDMFPWTNHCEICVEICHMK